jgi:hypothetical protein
MGIAVDNGSNWYEHAVDDRSWLNLGLPVGFKEWSALVDRYHTGCKTLAIILYHPNMWIHCEMYRRWRESGLGVFSALKWKTSLSKCTHIYIRRLLSKRRLLRNGSWIEFTQNSNRYQIDANYARIQDSEVDTVFLKHITTLESITRRFRSVMIIRLPIKQELLPEKAGTKPLVSLISQYDRFWNLTKEHFQDWSSVSFHQPACFLLSHFHTDDSHWNVDGNLAFAKWLKHHLERFAIVNSQPNE